MSTYHRKPRLSRFKLTLPALLALLPLLVMSSGVVTTTQAAIPTNTKAEVQNPQTTLVFRVYFRDTAERDRLATEIGADEVSTKGGFLTKWADRATYDALKARGLRVEIDDVATKKANVPIQWRRDNPLAKDNPDTFYGGYHTVEEMYQFLDQKVTSYPTLVEKVDIGDSWCKTHPGLCTQPNSWNGFDLFVMHITNRNIAGPKPVFWYDGGIHSREIATPEVAMRFIEYLLSNYDTDADAHWLVDYHDIWVMPMLNPDGHHMNESNGQGTPTLHRRNADRDDGCNTYDQFGTDINRNFPFVWGCCGGSSSSPCSDVYRGPSQMSEEETASMVTKVRSLIPDQRGTNESDPAPITTTGTLINMHSNASLNLYPWGYTTSLAPNRTDLRNIGKHMSSPNVLPRGNGYITCQNTDPNCLYVVDGDEKNWVYGELGSPGYSLEVAGEDFFPPYNCLDNGPPVCTDGDPGIGTGIWPMNKGALLYHSKISRTPYLLTRGPDTYASTSTPITVTLGTPALVTSTINYNWNGVVLSGSEANTYLQNVAVAEYYMDTPPWAGGTGVPMTAADGSYDSPTEQVQANIATGSLSLGRHIVYVRGRGVNNYEGFQSWGPVSAVWLWITGEGSPTVTSTPLAATATRTNTNVPNTPVPPTSTRTGTATSVAPSVTTTPTSCCGQMTGGVLSSCHVDATPSTTSFQGIVELNNPCPTSVPVTITTQLQISVDGTNWTTWTQNPSRQAVVPPGPPPYAVTENFINQSIPAQYNYYRIFSTVSELNNCREYFLMSPTHDICRVSTTPTITPTADATATACTITFTDVDENNVFYPFIRCLACRGIIGGYADGTFRPFNDITRGQIAKIVSNAAGFDEDPGPQIYEDVPEGSPFYAWINRLSMRGHIGGYPCGTVDTEPCVEPNNLPYFRPSNSATRGQLAKIVSNAAGLEGSPTGVFYTDVQEDHTFYVWIMRLTELAVMSGYDCGGEGEPCDSENRPYFRPFNNVTRGQASKIVANTFFPGCVAP
jgi:carboxypeptidase T